MRREPVPQGPTDEPASVLLKKIVEEKERLIKEGKIKKQKPLPKIREEENPLSCPRGGSGGLGHRRKLMVFSNTGFKVRGPSFICHSEGATRSGSIPDWKIFSEMLIEIPATEESPFPSLH